MQFFKQLKVLKKNKQTLLQAGLATANVDRFQREYANSIGKTSEKLNEAEKKTSSL